MDPRLADYIRSVRRIVSEPLSMAGLLVRVREAATELVSEPVELPDAARALPSEGYGRNLLYHDPDHGFAVLGLVWPGGIGTPPHDHGVWGVVAVSEGGIRVRTYRREDDGSSAGHASLVPLEELEATAGDVATTMPPHDDYHDITNLYDDRTSVTIHTYAVNMKACRIFDLDEKTTEIIKLRFTNELDLQLTT